MAKIIKNTKLILAIIILVAAFLRLWGLDKVPVSLSGDEVDVGYQAYSILKTGKDYYGNFLPIQLHSQAEWRTPFYSYFATSTVALFGISPYGIRLPAAIFGVLGVVAFYFLALELTKKESIALVAAAILAFSPWHIQFSRISFDVTTLLFFLFLGLLFFFKGIKNGKYLWMSALFFALTPWIYNTAKLFIPLLLVFLLVFYRKDIFKISKKYLVSAFLVLVVVASPIAYSTLFNSGVQRFDYIGIFSDPTIEPEVGTARGIDAHQRGEKGTGLNPTIIDRLIHNKFTFVGDKFLRNYLQPFSFDFLFNNGDPNPRHSIHEMGEFYKIEALALILGLVLFFSSKAQDHKVKALIAFWILAGVIPSALTRDGGNHATRLILILPPLAFLISVGIIDGIKLIKPNYRKLAIALYLGLWLLCFGFYQHNYWVHNPTYSERWWHGGFKEAVGYIAENQKDYDKVVISTAGEPPWIFFAAFYQYDPASWQKNFPIGNDVDVPGLGKVSHIDKFYFGSPAGGLYELGKVIDKKTLYMATATEVKVNLILEPDRTPNDLKLLKSVAYPSGEPVFYIFTGK